MILCVNFVLALLSTLSFPTFISDKTLSFSNSIFSAIFFMAIYAVLQKNNEITRDKRSIIYTHILGFMFSFMIATGHALDTYGEINFRSLVFSIVLFTHIIANMLQLFWRKLIKIEDVLKGNRLNGKAFEIIEKIMAFFIRHPHVIMIFLLICWLPCFIAEFPGGFRYDATKEFNQTVNGYSGDFPLLHSAIITKLLPAVYNLTGSYNFGVAIYVIIQMIMISCMYMHIIYTFDRKNINRLLLFVMLLFCGVFPVIQLLVVQEVRDVLFSSLLVYTMFLFYLLTSDSELFFKNKGNPFILGIFFVLTLLARNNNAGGVMWVIIIAVSIAVWIAYRKKHFRGVTFLSVTCVLGYFLIGSFLTSICQPLKPAQIRSSLSIVSQPLARTYIYHKNELTKDEIAELGRFMELEGLKYYAENADSTKSKIISSDLKALMKFWLKIGLKYPGCYADAILANTQNMWYPDSVIDGYNQKYSNFYLEGSEKCYLSIRGTLEPPAVHMNLLPKVLNYYIRISMYISFEKIPIVSMLFSIGFQFWAILNCLFYVMYRKLKKLILPVLIILGYMLISACVPLVLLRYFAAAFFAVPMLMVFTFQPDH